MLAPVIRSLLISGGVLQIIGISFAALGIRRLRKNWTTLPGLFRRSKNILGQIFKTVVRFLRRIFNLRPKTILATMAGSSSAVSGVRADLTVSRAPRPQSLLQQLDWFAGRIADLTTENDNLRKDLATISQRQEEADTFTRHELEQMDHEFRSKLTNLAAGGLQIQTWGVCFLIVGTLLTVWGSALR